MPTDDKMSPNADALEVPVDDDQQQLLAELEKVSIDFYKDMKEMPDCITEKYYKDIDRRWTVSESRFKTTEQHVHNLIWENRSLEEYRWEMLTELLDKAAQGFDIRDEHKDRRMPFGSRIVLEARLLTVINDAFDLIITICENFDRLRGDRHGVDNELEMLCYNIRYLDTVYTEVHERLLKSYLGMNW